MLEHAHNLLDRLEILERLAVAEAEEWLRHNPPVPNADVLREFGLTEGELERMAQEA